MFCTRGLNQVVGGRVALLRTLPAHAAEVRCVPSVANDDIE
jgi:hypothetical protein